MIFNSFEFILFFFFVIIFYWLLEHKKQNIFLLITSYIFYGWWDYRFLLLIFGSSLLDFVCAQQIHLSAVKKHLTRKKAFLVFSLIMNMSLLAFFKYFNFFLESFYDLIRLIGLNHQSMSLNIILPVGISFYTFQSMSYSIDIYQNKLKPTKSFSDFLLFISFFPQLVAGPIERPHSMLPQIIKPRQLKYENVITGVFIACLGFFKKAVIADNLSVPVDYIFDSFHKISLLETFLGSLLFSFQIYFDFSGYSDIAIGLALMLGFRLSINFKSPYTAKSLPEFWERWHITLSSWFRDYLFYPLAMKYMRKGENFLNKYKAYVYTMFLMGIWHGAGVNFIIFGIFWSLALVIYYQFQSSFNKLPAYIKMTIVFLCANLGWFLFRIKDLTELTKLSLKNESLFLWYNHWVLLIFSVGLMTLLKEHQYWTTHNNISAENIISGWPKYLLIILLIICCIFFSIQKHINFIYFQF